MLVANEREEEHLSLRDVTEQETALFQQELFQGSQGEFY